MHHYFASSNHKVDLNLGHLCSLNNFLKIFVDVDDGKLIVRVEDNEFKFNVFEAMSTLKIRGSVLEWMVYYSLAFVSCLFL